MWAVTACLALFLAGAVVEVPFAYFTFRRSVLTLDTFALTTFLQALGWAYLAIGVLTNGPCSGEDGCEPALVNGFVAPSCIVAIQALVWSLVGLRVVSRHWGPELLLGLIVVAGVCTALAIVYARLEAGSQYPVSGLAGLVAAGSPVLTLLTAWIAAYRFRRSPSEA